MLNLTNVQYSIFNIDQKKNQTNQPNNKKERTSARGIHPSRVSLARARSFFCAHLLPSACYAG